MRFEIHSATNNATATGIVSKIRGILPELDCGGEITLFDDKAAAKFCTTFNDDGTVAVEGIAHQKCLSKGLYPTVELADADFTTAEEPNKDYLSKKQNTLVQDRIAGKEVFRIYPKTENANWLATVLAPTPMPRITTNEADLAKF